MSGVYGNFKKHGKAAFPDTFFYIPLVITTG